MAIYIKSDIALYASVIEEVNDVSCNLEQFWIQAGEPGRKYFVISVMYRPPAGCMKIFLDELNGSLKYIFEKTGSGEHIVMGDYNVDFSHKEKHTCKKLKDIMNDYGLRYHSTGYTRITAHSKSTIDLMFSDMHNVFEVGVKSIVISDHLPTYIIRKKMRNSIEKEQIEIRKMWNYSLENLEEMIRADERWMNFWENNVSVDELWDIMYNIFLDAVNSLCPIIKKTVQKNRPSWVTKEVTDAISEKNRLYNVARDKNDTESWNSFRVNKKLTSKLITQTKCEVTKNRLRENSSNPKRFWRQINRDILGKENGDGIKVIKDKFGNCLNGIEAANYINTLYAGFGKGIDQTYQQWTEGSMGMSKIDQEYEFKFIELLEIHQLVKGIDVNKASGIEYLSAKILKDCFEICEYELTYLMNCSVHTMKFPRAWKKCIVTPIPKSGDKLNPENWRPINNLCIPGKILEKCIYRQIEEYMEMYNLFCRNQHGFRKGKGTDTAVMELVRELFSNINKNDTSSVLFLDYSKAFNTVNHQILLRKMLMYGFSKNVCMWFEDYFRDRMQYTKVEQVVSSGVLLEHGVYQGSPLGPLLFIMYINDIVNVCNADFTNIYADDTVIICADKSIDKAVDCSIATFGVIQDWCMLNNIVVNTKKTKHMIMGGSMTKCDPTWEKVS